MSLALSLLGLFVRTFFVSILLCSLLVAFCLFLRDSDKVYDLSSYIALLEAEKGLASGLVLGMSLWLAAWVTRYRYFLRTGR